uniref:Transmembrane protein n=1 Tax=Chromera velia CCMP2878 TaxID=1169474 RepID=A0A0G4G0F7_9ALVE|eukprot:Cvel_19528.t1-p1 / transcript=Cvel_19528.t1 / gene=Cvel_19528 / organism=Chromera_velia_CCMP2878 / gene_product=hypothetical protein / transcript_product=hypothetical protein / location=Cvel_scaffold1690:32330-34685(+) / protein_length=573 / sequence_SO=supercontig / SO=protein_coding / is_pseudo=false
MSILSFSTPAQKSTNYLGRSFCTRPKCLTFFPTPCDLRWGNFREIGPLWQTSSLLFLEITMWILMKTLRPLRSPESEKTTLLEVNDNLAVGFCASQLGLEFFLPLQDFWVFRGVVGCVCILSGLAAALCRFILRSRTLLDVLGIVLVNMLPHIMSIAYVRGAQQHRANTQRRERVGDPPVLAPKVLEEGACACRAVGRVAKFAVSLLSPKRAASQLHCGLIVLIKVLGDYMDVSTDLAAGFLFLGGDTATSSSISVAMRWGVGMTIVVFGAFDALSLAAKWSIPIMSDRICVLVYTVSLCSEVAILCATTVLTVLTWEELEENQSDLTLAVLNLVTTALGIPLGLIILFVNGADAEFNKLMTSVRRLSRRLSGVRMDWPSGGGRSRSRERERDKSPPRGLSLERKAQENAHRAKETTEGRGVCGEDTESPRTMPRSPVSMTRGRSVCFSDDARLDLPPAAALGLFPFPERDLESPSGEVEEEEQEREAEQRETDDDDRMSNVSETAAVGKTISFQIERIQTSLVGVAGASRGSFTERKAEFNNTSPCRNDATPLSADMTSEVKGGDLLGSVFV